MLPAPRRGQEGGVGATAVHEEPLRAEDADPVALRGRDHGQDGRRTERNGSNKDSKGRKRQNFR